VLGAEPILANAERLLVQRQGLLVGLLRSIQTRQVVQAQGGIGVVGPSTRSQIANARSYSGKARS
jgi:hypothetical protein